MSFSCLLTLYVGGGALAFGEALKNRVRSLVESGELERLESADGQTGDSRRKKSLEETNIQNSRDNKKLECFFFFSNLY